MNSLKETAADPDEAFSDLPEKKNLSGLERKPPAIYGGRDKSSRPAFQA